MSVNLLDLAKGYLTDAVVSKAASFLGESSEATQTGLAHAMPALLGGIMSKANSESGASSLLNLMDTPSLGDGLLSNLGDLFGGGNSSMLDLGGSLLSGVFGNKLGGITDLIASATGLKSGTSSTILKMAMPFLFGIIKKQVANKGVSGLMSLLSGQKDYLAKAAPAGFMDKMLGTLGVGSLGNLASNAFSSAKETTSNVVNEVENTAKKGGNKMLPFLGILALAALAFFAMRNCKADTAVKETIENVKEDSNHAADAVRSGAEKVSNGAKAAAGAVVDDANALYTAGASLLGKTVKGFENLGAFAKRKLKDGTELIIPSKGFEYRLVDFIEGNNPIDKTTWFDMRRVLFKTGSAELDSRSMGQINSIVSILKAYPNVHLKIGGYTDNTGNANANKVLSGKRAAAVVSTLTNKGIDAKRLTAEGYGQEHPIATNDTAEGRQLNRRVSARVTKK